ncbi:MAG TPA: hypothetical protein VFA26_09825 [Gemmataceae bacterium]|nr:hypothetical protein [Gemmataceae bacterium]
MNRTRRKFLWQVGGGFAGLALIDLLSRDGFLCQGHGGLDQRLTGFRGQVVESVLA